MQKLNFHLAHIWQQQGISFVLATVIDTSGSTPRLQGAQMLIRDEEIQGSIGGGRIEYEVILEARKMIAIDTQNSTKNFQVIHKHLSHDLGMCCGGKMTVTIQAYVAQSRLWIYGAGHVATALAQQATLVELPCVVVDERDDWAHQKRFPKDVEVICENICEEIRLHPPQSQDYAFVCTHDHALDEEVMALLLSRPLSYLALIGSQRKWLQFRKRLQARGITQEKLDWVSCPAGLHINADTPAEIAVSVIAEIIQVRSQ